MENIFVNTEATQINLFEALKNMGRIQVQKKTYSSELPEKIKSFTGKMSLSKLADFARDIAGKKYLMMYKGLRYSYGYSSEYYDYNGDTPNGSELMGVPFDEYAREHSVLISVCNAGRDILKGFLMYVTEGGTVYEAEVKLTVIDETYDRNRYYVKTVEVSKWKRARLHAHKIECVLNEVDAELILRRVNPYASTFKDDFSLDSLNTVTATDLLIAPQLEQLHKAGYKIAEEVRCLLQGRDDSAAMEQFNRLTQPGRNMKEIFKTSKAVYTTLKECRSFSTWDIYRKMDKQGKITAENIERAYNGNYSEKELNEMNSILGQEYAGKKIFTWDSLQRYLERIDMYEAIERFEGLMLLKDYLSMCKQLEMKPRIDGDSLKREHDVVARTIRQKKDEIRAGKMVSICEENKKYDYSEHVYFGRCIRSYDDLIDEATQQHNCVASYADSIISKRCYIFVVRTVAEPNRSMATVEITPSGEIRQKLLAYNKPIHNKALTDFIDRLAKNFRAIRNRKPEENNLCNIA